MATVSDEADLDKLVTRIHADLRSGRRPGRPRPLRRLGRLKSLFGAMRRRRAIRALRGGSTGAWLTPVLIVAVVATLVLLFDAH